MAGSRRLALLRRHELEKPIWNTRRPFISSPSARVLRRKRCSAMMAGSTTRTMPMPLPTAKPRRRSSTATTATTSPSIMPVPSPPLPDPTSCLGGTQDNGTHRWDGGGIDDVIQTIITGDGMYCFIDQTNPNIAIAGTFNNLYLRSTDGGVYVPVTK